MRDEESGGAASFVADAPAVPPSTRRKRSLARRLFSLFSATVPLNRDRVNNPQAYPWSAVCLLNFFIDGRFEGHATGFFVATDVVVTAAHNIRRTNPDAVGIYPGYDAQLNPTNGVSGRSWAWDGSRDVAVIVTKGPGVAELGMGGAAPAVLTLAGYAFPYSNGSPQLTFGAGQWSKSGSELLYRIGVDEGDSGSPVFVPDHGGATAMAVHFERRMLANQGPVGVGEFADPDLRQVLARLEQRARAVP